MRTASFCALAVVAAAGVLAATQASRSGGGAAFDIVITNGRVIDGTGSPWYAADVGIRGGRIAAIGRLAGAAATTRIDAAGKVVAPGFIDMLGQSELTVLVEPTLPSKIFQGITTELTGEGGSVAPLDARVIEADRFGYEHFRITPDWRTFAQYVARVEKQGLGINMAHLVGATQVRRIVLGDADTQPTAAQLDRMTALVREAMEQGAFGVSTSLQYAPAPYAKTDELIALAAEASKHGGLYATHMRSEADGVLAALDEAIRIGREAKIRVEVWHVKAAGTRNWGRMPAIIAKIEQARRDGIDITADTYGYTAWYNSLSAFIPPWAHDGGDTQLIARLRDPRTRARVRADMLNAGDRTWDNEWQEIPGPEAVLIGAVHDPGLQSIKGKRLSEIAAEWKMDPIDALCEIVIRDHAFTGVAVFGMSEADVALAVRQPWVAFNNDSQGTAPTGLLGEEHPHPRAYGTFPRILRKFVREDHAITLEEAIRKMTALPAQILRLADRGVLKTGMWADVVVFDPAAVTDVATFAEPNQLSKGMDYVLVNGVPVIAAGQATGARPGQVLRGPGAR
jgi:dihydroorotase/N-acyl-D-amino-acid deacylase